MTGYYSNPFATNVNSALPSITVEFTSADFKALQITGVNTSALLLSAVIWSQAPPRLAPFGMTAIGGSWTLFSLALFPLDVF
jgi:hypothetical protein